MDTASSTTQSTLIPFQQQHSFSKKLLVKGEQIVVRLPFQEAVLGESKICLPKMDSSLLGQGDADQEMEERQRYTQSVSQAVTYFLAELNYSEVEEIQSCCPEVLAFQAINSFGKKSLIAIQPNLDGQGSNNLLMSASTIQQQQQQQQMLRQNNIDFPVGRLLAYSGYIQKMQQCVVIQQFRVIKDTDSGQRIGLIEYDIWERTLQRALLKKIELVAQQQQQQQQLSGMLKSQSSLTSSQSLQPQPGQQQTQQQLKVLTQEEFNTISKRILQLVLQCHSNDTAIIILNNTSFFVVDGSYFLADFYSSSKQIGASDFESSAVEHVGGDTIKAKIDLQYLQVLLQQEEEQLYLSPQLKNAAQQQSDFVSLDPFKSDLYSAGLLLLELLLFYKNSSAISSEVKTVLSNNELALKAALENYINDNLMQRNNFIGLEGQRIVYYKTENILNLILQQEEEKRISSVRLALMLQMDSILLNNVLNASEDCLQPNYINMISNVNTEQQDLEKVTVDYTMRQLHYEGTILKQTESSMFSSQLSVNKSLCQNSGSSVFGGSSLIVKEGQGKLFKYNKANKLELVYEGTWKNNRPDGEGRCLIFGHSWWYEGQFKEGIFFQKGRIMFNGKPIFEGSWFGFVLLFDKNVNWLVPQREMFGLEIDNSMLLLKNEVQYLDQPEPIVIKGQHATCHGKQASGVQLQSLQQQFQQSQQQQLQQSQQQLQQQQQQQQSQVVLLQQQKIGFKVDENNFDFLFSLCGQVEVLNFSFFLPAAYARLSPIITSPQFAQLKIVRMAVTNESEAEILVMLLNRTEQQLICLDLSGSTDLTLRDNEIAKTIITSPHLAKTLNELSLRKCCVSTPFSMQKFIQAVTLSMFFEGVRCFDASDSAFDPRQMEYLVQSRPLPQLKRLILRNCVRLTIESLQLLSESLCNLPGLEYLDLCGAGNAIFNTGTSFFSNTEALSLNLFKKLLADISQQLTSLNTLVLDQTVISDAAIEYMSRLNYPALTTLSLKYCQRISFKGLHYLQLSASLPMLNCIVLDYSAVALPKPVQEKWKNLRLSIIECKNIDIQNLCEYIKQSIALKDLTISSRTLSYELTMAINYTNRVQRINIEVVETQDAVKILQFLRQIDKENNELQLINITSQLEGIYDMLWQDINQQVKNGEIQKKNLFDIVRFGYGSSYKGSNDGESKNQQETTTKQMAKQFMEGNEYYQRKIQVVKIFSDQLFSLPLAKSQISMNPTAALAASSDVFRKDFRDLVNHQICLNLDSLDFSKVNLDDEGIEILKNGLYIQNLRKINLSNSMIQEQSLQKLGLCDALKSLRHIVLLDVPAQCIDGIDFLIASTDLPALEILSMGYNMLDKIIKPIMFSNQNIQVPFYRSLKVFKDKMEIKICGIRNKSSCNEFSFFVDKGKKKAEPKRGDTGTLKIKLNAFTTLSIKNEQNIQRLYDAIMNFFNFLQSTNFSPQIFSSGSDARQDSLKIIVIGQQLSGKMSLIRRWSCNTFSECNAMTSGTVYYNKDTIKNEQLIRTNLWYISSQPFYKQMQRFFCQDADVIIIVFDVTSPDVEQDLQPYLEELKILKMEKTVVLVGNKIDKPDRQFSKEKGKQISLDNDILYFETSAKTGEYIEELFDCLIKDSLKKSRKPTFTNDMLTSLGGLISRQLLNKIELKFNFLKSKGKIRSDIMEEFCQKIISGMSIKEMDLLIKNWFSITNDEKDILGEEKKVLQ